MHINVSVDNVTHKIIVSPFDTPSSLKDRIIAKIKRNISSSLDWSLNMWRELMETGSSNLSVVTDETIVSIPDIEARVESFRKFSTKPSTIPLSSIEVNTVTSAWEFSPKGIWDFDYLFDGLRLDHIIPACALFNPRRDGVFKLYEKARTSSEGKNLKQDLGKFLKESKFSKVTRTTFVIWFYSPELSELSIQQSPGGWRLTLISTISTAELAIARLADVLQGEEDLSSLKEPGIQKELRGIAAIPLSEDDAKLYSKFLMMDYLTSNPNITPVAAIHEPSVVNRFSTENDSIVKAMWYGNGNSRVNFSLVIASTNLAVRKLIPDLDNDYHIEIGFHKATHLNQAKWICNSIKWIWSDYLANRSEIYSQYRRVVGDSLRDLLVLPTREHSTILPSLQAAEPTMFKNNNFTGICESRRYPMLSTKEKGVPFGPEDNANAKELRYYSCDHNENNKEFVTVKVTVGNDRKQKQDVPCCAEKAKSGFKSSKGTYEKKSSTNPAAVGVTAKIPKELESLLSASLGLNEFRRLGTESGFLEAVLIAVGDKGYASANNKERYVSTYRLQSLLTKNGLPISADRYSGLRSQMPDLTVDEILQRVRSDEFMRFSNWVKLVEYHFSINLFCYSVSGRSIEPTLPSYKGVLLPTDALKRDSIILLEIDETIYEPVYYGGRQFRINNKGTTILHNMLTISSGVSSLGNMYDKKRLPLETFFKSAKREKASLKQWLDSWGKVRGVIYNGQFIFTPPMEPVVGFFTEVGNPEFVNRDIMGLEAIPITKKKYKDYVVFYAADEKKSVIGIAVLSNSSKILGKYWVPTIPSESEKDDDGDNEKKAKYMMFYLQWDFAHWLRAKPPLELNDLEDVKTTMKEWAKDRTILKETTRETIAIASTKSGFYSEGKLAFYDFKERSHLIQWLYHQVLSQSMEITRRFGNYRIVDGFFSGGYKRLEGKVLVGIHSVWQWLDDWVKGNAFVPVVHNELPKTKGTEDDVLFVLSNEDIVLAQKAGDSDIAKNIVRKWGVERYVDKMAETDSGIVPSYSELDDVTTSGVIDNWAILL